ncbi:MAG: NAD(+)/NADH kinase [Clostridia bacterium]|nr:NAD(+)/NADH kinase [Clostridia bacterium]
MKFLIYPNRTSGSAMAFLAEAEAELRAAGHDCAVYEDGTTPPRDTDIVLTIGGDGTVLRAIRALCDLDVPFWAVNRGHLGYLTECEPEDLRQHLKLIEQNHHHLEKRVMLCGSLNGGETFFGLNETVIHRCGYTRTLRIEVAVEGSPIMAFAGDGILVATATGSTAYNLSAGGPILLPESRELVITPICAHSALCAPMVVPGDKEITVIVSMEGEDAHGMHPQMVTDGLVHHQLKAGDSVRCRLDTRTVKMVKTTHDSFYQLLQKKMSMR